MIAVTYKQVRAGGACADEAYKRLRRVRRRLGRKVGLNEPVDLLVVLDVCGIDDALSAMRWVRVKSSMVRLWGYDCAERVLLRAAGREFGFWTAAKVARRYAWDDATHDAAREAARDAADVVAWVADSDVSSDAWDVAWDAERAWQAQRLRLYLTGVEVPAVEVPTDG